MTSLFRPRFSHVVVEISGNYKRFEPPIKSPEIAKYIGIPLSTLIKAIDPTKSRGQLQFLVVTPGGSETRVRVYYERKTHNGTV